MVLVGIVGHKGSGKDTLADYLVLQYGFTKRAFADPIKEACTILFQLAPEQLTDRHLKEAIDPRHGLSPRQMMQIVGTDMFRFMVDKRFWINHFLIWYGNIKNSHNVVVPDVRFQNELDTIKQLGGFVIRLVRPGLAKVDAHVSEAGIDDLIGIDATIVNDASVMELYKRYELIMLR